MGQFSNPVATHPRTNEVEMPPRAMRTDVKTRALNLCCKPPVLYELQTEKKQLRLILQNNLVNSLMFVYQDMIEKLPN